MSKSVLNEIKTLLGMTVKLEQMKLKNGTILEAESFEIGWDLFIVSEDGEKVPTPEGEYELEDGRIIRTDAQGVIVSIGEPEAEQPAEEVEEEMEKEKPGQEAKAPKKVVETNTTEVHFSKELHDSILSRLEALELAAPKVEMKEEVKDVKVEMSEKITHNPEEAKKSFHNVKRNMGYSTKNLILSKISKIGKN